MLSNECVGPQNECAPLTGCRGPGSVAEPTAKIYGMMQFGFKMVECTYTYLTYITTLSTATLHLATCTRNQPISI